MSDKSRPSTFDITKPLPIRNTVPRSRAVWLKRWKEIESVHFVLNGEHRGMPNALRSGITRMDLLNGETPAHTKWESLLTVHLLLLEQMRSLFSHKFLNSVCYPVKEGLSRARLQVVSASRLFSTILTSPFPSNWTALTRKLVPPRSSDRKVPVSLPVGKEVTNEGIIEATPLDGVLRPDWYSEMKPLMIGAIWSLVNRNWSSSLLKTCSYEAMTIETCNSQEKNSGEKGRVRKKIVLQLLMKLFFSILKGGKIFECQFLLVLCVDARQQYSIRRNQHTTVDALSHPSFLIHIY